MRLRSTTSYRGPENIGIVAIVKSELKLRQIKRQKIFADMMVGSDDSAFQQRPERFHIVCAADAAHVFADTVIAPSLSCHPERSPRQFSRVSTPPLPNCSEGAGAGPCPLANE